MDYLDIVIRSFVSLGMLFITTKLMGAKQISQLSFFDYVVGISVGSIAACIAVDQEIDLIYGVIGIAIYGFTALLISIVTNKSIILRRFFTGTTIVLMKNGRILYNGLKRSHFDINDLLSEARYNGYFDLRDIDYAIMETNGRISFLPKANKRPVNCSDLLENPKPNEIFVNVIIDKKILYNNLASFHDEEWLLKELKKQKVRLNEIALATLDKNDNLIIFKIYNDSHLI